MVSFTFSALLTTALFATIAHSGYAAYVPNPPHPSCPNSNTITVTGGGSTSIKTSTAVITVGLRAKGDTEVIARKNLFDIYKILFTYLQAQNAKNIQGKYVSVYQDYSYNSGYGVYSTPEPSAEPYGSNGNGYVGTKSVTFEVQVAKSAVVIDGAILKGATSVDGVTFKSDPVEVEAARKVAIDDAVKSAKKEASAAALALGKTIGKALSVKIPNNAVNGNYYGGAPYYGGHSSAPYYGGHSGAGDQIVTVLVNVSYAMW